MADGKRDTDWDAIEREYKAGQLSIREIARQFDVDPSYLSRKAREKKWKRALAGQVRVAVAEKLVRDGVSPQSPHGSPQELAGEDKPSSAPASADSRTDAEIVEAAAQRGVEVVRQHMKTLAAGNTLVAAMIEELARSTLNQDEIVEAITEETAEPAETEETKAARRDRLRRRSQMLQAISLPQRAQTMQSLSASLRNLIPLERKTFNLDEQPEGDDEQSATEKLYKQISGNRHEPVLMLPAPGKHAQPSAIRPADD